MDFQNIFEIDFSRMNFSHCLLRQNFYIYFFTSSCHGIPTGTQPSRSLKYLLSTENSTRQLLQLVPLPPVNAASFVPIAFAFRKRLVGKSFVKFSMEFLKESLEFFLEIMDEIPQEFLEE